MNAIRQIAANQFQSKAFRPTPDEYDVTVSDAESLVHHHIPWAELQQKCHDQTVSFLLVKVQFYSPFERNWYGLGMDDCYKLLELFEIEESSLGLVATDMTGFHRLGNRPNSNTRGYYLQCGAYKFIWSYSSQSRSTRAVAFIYNSSNGIKGFNSFLNALRTQTGLIGNPLYIPITAAAETIGFMDKILRSQYEKCRKTESNTGIHPWRFNFRSPDAVREFTTMSKEMHTLVVEVEMVVRMLKHWTMAIDEFAVMLNADRAESATHDPSLSSALDLLQSRLKVMEVDFNYIRARATNQLHAISQTMARDDAVASIQLARSASHDSSSMKVVAVMTMAFLPGTFIAALFAVPSLKWDSQHVIQGNFWVYWAFTLPSTAMVFTLWYLFTKGIPFLPFSTEKPFWRLKNRTESGFST